MRASYSTETLTLPTFIAGDFKRVTRKVTILAGAALAAGAVLGRVTTSGKFTLSATAAGDGSETPRAILAEALPASGADQEAIVYLSGEFRADGLTFGAGHSAASTRDGLRDLSIFI